MHNQETPGCFNHALAASAPLFASDSLTTSFKVLMQVSNSNGEVSLQFALMYLPIDEDSCFTKYIVSVIPAEKFRLVQRFSVEMAQTTIISCRNDTAAGLSAVSCSVCVCTIQRQLEVERRHF
ncbi:hypothetical protein M8C21_023093, partial [Ambrosia artemisiifolia]